jgi:phosphate transport system substrate-binding protein
MEASTSAMASMMASPSASASSAGAATTATGTAGTEVAAIELPEVDPGSVTGDIITAGSSTVFPLSQRMAERFKSEGYGGNVTVDSIGTGGGFERFCEAKETDIANASRAIKDEERQACGADREPIEFRVGTDALVVAVSSENDFLTNLTKEQLAQVFTTATNWSDIDPSFPNETIRRFTPGTDSGTFDYFVEEILDDEPAGLLQAQNLQQSEDDNVLVQGIEGSPYAIGFFGFAYFQENESRLTAISIDDVEPNAESAENGEYPLARPLFIYSARSVMEAKPQVADFINFYLTNVNDEIEDVGYFAASNEALNQAKQAWQDASQ